MKRDIIGMLNEDLAGEHAAIIQYLAHAYGMGEGELACEIEAIAREEMRHFDWLAETIVGLGGTPTLARGPMRTGKTDVREWMKDDVLQESDGISLYEEHVKAVDDRKIRRLLQRILSDELAHRAKFEHFIQKVEKHGLKDLRGSRQDKLTGFLGWGIEHEYTVILQYLLHSYVTKNLEARKEWEDQAINEMQHLGWLAEEAVSAGGSPTIEHTDVDQSKKTSDMLRTDIKIEGEVAAEYNRAAAEVEDKGLKDLFLRLRDHELYHEQVFSDLLRQEGR